MTYDQTMALKNMECAINQLQGAFDRATAAPFRYVLADLDMALAADAKALTADTREVTDF
jgi:hypothetical protein